MTPSPLLAAPPSALVARLAPLHAAMTHWRHALHAHPELAHQEHATAALVARVLGEAGLAVTQGVGGTGVVATVHGREAGGASLGLRADMDALAVREAASRPHASCQPGVMHACGHDGHVAMLLGAACHLARTRAFAGTVQCVFQPAEEGAGGADAMIADGLFERFPMERVFSLHTWPDLPAGAFAVHDGPVMAACDAFTVTIQGRGAHAAQPQRAVDPVLVAGHLITATQSLISRGTDPFESAVVSITRVEAGQAFNVIPDTARLEGSMRCLSEGARERLRRDLARLVEQGAAAFGATASVSFRSVARVTANTPAEAALAARVAGEVVGPAQVARTLAPSMTAEDFGSFLAHRPGAYVWLGQGAGEDPPALHQPTFDFNDAVLGLGAAWWVGLVEAALPEGKG
ncbi:amidohydrolase [Pararhodospirillum oryzae]|uniref:Amidohydrolase n=1 Tax=Pararhodospirillum oryzae TaxID=478448 RepID=A0A512H8X5_9PROT|nr:amidohydrolase [Pararhodospirillum oryzae]GEO81906.1 amidohydrolase [Pararhodospirillum oryzae]